MVFCPRRKRTNVIGRNSALIALLAPALILLSVVTVYPLVRLLLLSFFVTDYGFEDARFVGFENYSYLLTDAAFQRAVWNTIAFSLLATTGEVSLGLALALLVNERILGRTVIIPSIFAPFVLSTMVVTAVWRAWFHYDFGFLNNVLRGVSLEPVEWLFDPELALLSLVLMDIWQTAPFVFLLLLAGLQSIPKAVYEAAKVDGAGTLRSFWSVTLPLLQPYILTAALLRCLDTFKIFDKVYALTGGGPGRATETLSLHVYRIGFKFFDVGLASAAAVVMVVIAAGLAAVYATRLIRGTPS